MEKPLLPFLLAARCYMRRKAFSRWDSNKKRLIAPGGGVCNYFACRGPQNSADEPAPRFRMTTTKTTTTTTGRLAICACGLLGYLLCSSCPIIEFIDTLRLNYFHHREKRIAHARWTHQKCIFATLLLPIAVLHKTSPPTPPERTLMSSTSKTRTEPPGIPA